MREAGLMHKVYSHSHCNISASAAKDSSEGLFRTRQPHLILPTHVEVCVADLAHTSDYVHCAMHDLCFWTHSVSSCTINKRAWVTQERLLAPRILHFGESELLWECMERNACESYPTGLPDPFQTQVSTRFKALEHQKKATDTNSTRRGPESDSTHDDYYVWNSIIEAYTATLLTVPSDKLIALSGLAKKFLPRMDDVYVAGMWKRWLNVSLLWYVDNGQKVDGSPSSRPQYYRAPSWSWASVDGVITRGPHLDGEWSIHVVEYSLEHATDDITSVVTAGWIDIRGDLRPTGLEAYELGIKLRWRMVLNGIIVCCQDESLPETGRFGPMVHLDVPPTDERAFEEDNHHQRLFYMMSRSPKSGQDWIPFLLLRLIDPDQVIFERIGLAMCSPYDGLPMLIASLEEDAKRALPSSRYEDGVHTIRVV